MLINAFEKNDYRPKTPWNVETQNDGRYLVTGAQIKGQDGEYHSLFDLEKDEYFEFNSSIQF